jgi:thyroid receptor-interacting protein 11
MANIFLSNSFAVASYHKANESLKRQLEESNANTSNADVDLIKNLVIGYITAPNATAKTQILKLISNVLSLNDQECSRIGLRHDASSFSSWFSKGGSDSVNNNVSLTEAFVAFLEKESAPRVNTNLLSMHDAGTSSRKTSTTENLSETPASAEANQAPPLESHPAPILLGENSLLTPYSNRSSSTILKDLLHDT